MNEASNPLPLLGMTPAELKNIAISLKMPSFTGKQIAEWLYKTQVGNIDEMTNISKINRQKLSANYSIGNMPHIEVQTSRDGTKKYLFPTSFHT